MLIKNFSLTANKYECSLPKWPFALKSAPLGSRKWTWLTCGSHLIPNLYINLGDNRHRSSAPWKVTPCLVNRCQGLRNKGLRLPHKKSNPDQVKWKCGGNKTWWQLIIVSALVVVMGPYNLAWYNPFYSVFRTGAANSLSLKKLHNVNILVFMDLYHRFFFLFTSTVFKYVKAIAQRHTRIVL